MAAVVACAAVACAAVIFWSVTSGRIGEPSDPNVVASFQGGEVTIEELKARYQALPPADLASYRTLEGLKVLVRDAAAEAALRGWAQERQIDRQVDFAEALKHATEAIQISEISEQMHQGRIAVGEADIQAYFDQNRGAFGERSLTEVREQVRRAIVEQREGEFVTTYLNELRVRAGLQVDYSLLEVPRPDEGELVAYYGANRERFRVPEKVRIAQIQVSISLAGGDRKARALAETVRARAAAGEDFAELARTFSHGPEKALDGVIDRPVAAASRGALFDEQVMPLAVGSISAVYREGDSYYVIKVLERWAAEQLPFEKVRGAVAAALLAERTSQVYAERANRTLVTIHSRRITLGEFLREREELPPEERALNAGPSGIRRLVEGMIDRLLIVEDAADQAVDVKRAGDVQHARTDLLARLLHQEQVDEAMTVSAEDIAREYRRNRNRYVQPARVRVRYIRVSRGETEDTDRKARAKIDQARDLLKPRRSSGQPPADFAEIAGRYSEDPDTAAKGGDLEGWLGETGNALSEAHTHSIHRALLPLAVGDLSPVLELGRDYYLFQIRDKQEARALSLEEAGERVRHDLQARRHEELSARMLRDLEARMRLRTYAKRLRVVLTELDASARGNLR